MPNISSTVIAIAAPISIWPEDSNLKCHADQERTLPKSIVRGPATVMSSATRATGENQFKFLTHHHLAVYCLKFCERKDDRKKHAAEFEYDVQDLT